MAAKVARCRPDLYTDAEVTIWLDVSGRLYQPDSVRWLLESLGDGTIAQFDHPERSDIFAEAEVSAGMRKYHGQSMRQQVDHYRLRGFSGQGLWASGCIIRRTSEAIARFGDTWLIEMCRWSWQDQLSEPYALWQHGINPVALPGNLWANPYVGFDYSLRKRDD
jgi:hypothetical protein